MADSVGKISLDLELQGDLTKQINEAASKIGEQLKASLQGVNFNGIAESLGNSIKKSMESTMKGIQESLEKTINKAISGATSTSRKIKVPIDYAIPSNSAVPKANTVSGLSSPRAPPTAKVNSGVNFEAVKAQIENLTQGLDITNAKIEQQKIKLQGLKEAYASTFNEAQKNKLQDQILKTEATINKLTSASDKAGFKIADLDSSMNSLGNSAKKASSSVNTLGNTAKSSTSKASSGMNRISRMLDRMIIRMFLFNTVIKGITALGSFLGSALMTNTQFANSLLQIKTNLEVAFMPIYQAILPAINALMRGLSTVTAYIAAFVNTLFGKTYQASYGAAKSLNTSISKMKELGGQSKKTSSAIKKAAKEATGALAGFDEINQLKMSTPAATGATPSSGGGLSVPALKEPSVDLSATSVAMSKISSIVNGAKKALATINFEPLIMAFDNLKAAATPIVETIGSNIKWLLTDILIPLANWTIGKALPAFLDTVSGALKVVNPILQIFSQASRDLWDNFLKPIAAWTGGIIVSVLKDLGNALSTIGDWMSGNKILINDIAIVVASFAAAWALVNIAIGVWNIIGAIATGVTGAFSGAVLFLTSPITLVILAIGALIAAVVLIIKYWPQITNAAKACWTAIVNTFKGIGTWFGNVFTGAWNGIKKAFSGVGSFFKGVWNTIKSMFTSIGSTIGNAIGGAFKYVINSIIGFAQNTINGFIRAINGAIGLINKIPGVNIRTVSTLKIPRLAKGGVLDQPTLAMVGEAGKEAVMPLENNTGWIDTLAGKLNSKGQSSDEVTRLLQIIIDILKNLDLDIDIDGDNLGKVIIKKINKLQRQAGKTLINI